MKTRKIQTGDDKLRNILEKFEVQPITLGMIGMSGCGGNAVQRMLEDSSPNDNLLLRPIIMDTDGENLRMRVLSAYEGKLPEQSEEAHEGELSEELELPSNFYRWVFPENGNKNRCEFLQLGPKVTKGKGAGGNPELGEKAALEDETVEALNKILSGPDINFIITGLGGGSGSGGAPIVASQSVNLGKTTVCLAVKPFASEGIRMKYANKAEKKMLKVAPTFIIYNDNLYGVLENDSGGSAISHDAAFKLINAQSIDPELEMFKRLLLGVGLVNVDARDFEELCKLGHRLYFGHSDFPAGQTDPEVVVDKVFTELTTNPFQDPQIVMRAKGYILMLSGTGWTVDHERLLKQKIEAHLGDSSKISDVRTWTGIFPGDSRNVAVLLTAAPYKQGFSADVQNSETAFSAQGKLAASSLPPIQKPLEPLPESERPSSIRYTDSNRVLQLRVTPETKDNYEALFHKKYPFNMDPQEKLDTYKHAVSVIERLRLETGDASLLVPPHLNIVNVNELEAKIPGRTAYQQTVAA